MSIDTIGIIGAGELGQALGHVLEKTGLRVLYYDKQDDRTTTASIGDVVGSCPVLFLCVPSWANAEVAKSITKHANPQHLPLVITLSKGVESKFVTMDQVLQKNLPPGTPFGLLYGPMIASELIAHQMGAGVLALTDRQYGEPVKTMLAKARIYIELSDDIHGTAVSGVLKNVYAMAFGMADGMKLGANARGKLATLVLREMKHILASAHANAETAEGLAGLGDLLATGTSETSFNYRVGKSIAEGIADEKVKSEGLVTLKELEHVVNLSECPVAQSLNKLVYHYGEPKELQALLEA